MSAYRVSSQLVEHPDEVEADWRVLEGRADCSYFQSWGWIGPWLRQVALDLQPRLIRVWHEDELVGMGLFVEKALRRRVLVNSHVAFLNDCPFDDRNMVIEYNGLLAVRGYERDAYRETTRYFLQEHGRVDEINFGLMADTSFLAGLDREVGDVARVVLAGDSSSWFVDLALIGDTLDSFLEGLSKNRRWQIRRSIRLYEQRGPLQFEEADTLEQAVAYFDGLKRLHSDRWQARGQPGSFANRQWERFHRALIETAFPRGEIQLLKVSNPDGTLGYLYNLVWRKHVYVAQTGFSVPEDNRLKPAYVSHALAVMHNRRKGMSIYDLMYGDGGYKSILCKCSRELSRVVIQRKRLKFGIENLAIRAFRTGRRMFG